MALVESQFTTVAGEYFVAYKLATLGLVPALIRQGVRAVDMIVSNADGSRAVGVQIKSVPSAVRDLRSAERDGLQLEFPISHRTVEQTAETTIFCFVDLKMRATSATPDVYIVPGANLKKECLGVFVRKYSATRYQRSQVEMECYRNNWQPFLEALAANAPRLRMPVNYSSPAAPEWDAPLAKAVARF